MSSDGSVMSSVSRIRQFGLYRSVDARTEEFLRASRKRQLRQGCACAAVSTAITVTVVVSIILVYEYSINGESNINKKLSLKPNWIGLMNDQTHVTQMDTKFTKKINFDKTTMKLLPILIRALNTNRYLEKILEDYSSTSPANDRKYTTEFDFKKNVFDKKILFKMPTSRLYTTDYKTSPALLKIPAKNHDYFRKRRKMKDYQRMLNYFDKMVGDKMGSSQPVISNVFESTMGPMSKYNNTLPIKSHKYETPKHETTTMSAIKVDDKRQDSNCKCPKNLGQMLSNLINSLKEMISKVVPTKLSVCENKTSTITTSSRVFGNSRQKGYTWRNTFFKTSTGSYLSTPKTTQFTTEKSGPEGIESSTFSSTGSNIVFHKMFFRGDETSPLTPYFKGDYNRYYSLYGNKNIIAPKRLSTKKYVITEKRKTLPKTTDHVLLKDTVTPAPFTSAAATITTSEGTSTRSLVATPVPQDYEYDDYVFATLSDTKVVNNNNSEVDFILSKKQSFTGESQPGVYRNSLRKSGLLSKQIDHSPSLLKKDKDYTRKIKDIINLPTTKPNEHLSTAEADDTEFRPSQVTPYQVLLLTRKPGEVNPIHGNTIATENEFINMTKYGTKQQGYDDKTEGDAKVNQEINIDNIMTDLDLDKILPEDEFQEQLSTKHIENTIDVSSNYNNRSKLLDLWDMLNHDNYPMKSMLPHIRPANLEVQRNSDWRHENQRDYDSNYNNNAFNMPNI